MITIRSAAASAATACLADGRLVFTPERPTGVVEKCTFCVERIDAD